MFPLVIEEVSQIDPFIFIVTPFFRAKDISNTKDKTSFGLLLYDRNVVGTILQYMSPKNLNSISLFVRSMNNYCPLCIPDAQENERSNIRRDFLQRELKSNKIDSFNSFYMNAKIILSRLSGYSIKGYKYLFVLLFIVNELRITHKVLKQVVLNLYFCTVYKWYMLMNLC